VKQGPAPEIIEIIDDDADLGGPRHSAPRPADDTSRRWVGPVAAAALLAVIGYGVVSTAISNGAATSHSATTTPRPSNAGPGPPVNRISPQFYIADPAPAGFTMHFAETLGMGGNPADFTDTTTAQLWATANATANNGSWFVVSRGTHHATGRNAYRTVVGTVEVMVEKDPVSGQSRLSFNKDGDNLEITAFGWADRQLLRLVDSVFVRDSQIQFHDAFFATDHTQLLDTDPPTALYGLPVAWVGYTTAVPASMATSFTITVAGPSLANRDVAIRFAMVNAQPIAIGDLPGIIGQSAADPRLTIVQWQDGPRLITVRGNLDAGALAYIAGSVHAAPNEVVMKQVRTDQPSAPVGGGQQYTVGSGWLDGPWAVHVSVDPASPVTFVWWISTPSGTVTADESRVSAQPGPTIDTFVENGRTYVLAKVPRSMADALLHVNPTGLPSTELAMIDVDPGLDAVFAAYAFREPVPYTAQLVDVGGGQTIVSWPAT
jgi:hypothetical protein